MQSEQSLRVASPVSLVDIPPTILDILNIPSPSSFRGRSLVPAMSGEDFPAEPVFSDRLDTNNGSSGFDGLEQDYSVVEWPYHLIWRNPASIQLMRQFRSGEDCHEQILQEGDLLLFNLEDDPLEQEPLLDSEIQESMVRLICIHIKDVYEFHNATPRATASSRIPEDQLERLRSLGYLS